MELQSQQKPGFFPLLISNSNHLFLVSKRYPARVKPLEAFSKPTRDPNPEQENDVPERAPTEDTISDTKENREDFESAASLQNNRRCSIFSSQSSTPRSSVKPILKSPRIGASNKKPDLQSSMQSFLDSNFDQLDSNEVVFFEKQEPKVLSNHSSPRRKLLVVSHVRHSSLNVAPVKPNSSKKVTFATILVEFQNPSVQERRSFRRSSLVSSTSSKDSGLSSPIFNLQNRPNHVFSNMRLPLVLSNTRNLVPVAPNEKVILTAQTGRRHSCPVELSKN